jgi:hypothetical protein
MRSSPTTVRATVLRAFRERVRGAVEAAENEYLVQLVTELRDRLCGLVPSRRDLHAEMNGAVNVALLTQMAEHDALRPREDFQQVFEAMFDWLQRLGAPADDAGVREQLAKTRASAAGGEFAAAVADAVLALHAGIDRIHKRIEQASAARDGEENGAP